MIWLGVSIVLASIVYTAGIVWVDCYLDDNKKGREKANLRLHATRACLIDLIFELNKHFPDSNLKLKETEDVVKVEGELKYLKQKD